MGRRLWPAPLPVLTSQVGAPLSSLWLNQHWSAQKVATLALAPKSCRLAFHATVSFMPTWGAIMKALLAAAATAALWAGSVSSLVQAAPIIDQQQLQVNATSGFQTGHFDLAQTFTVGISGRLDGISIVAANGGSLPIGLDLLETLAGLPTTVIANAVAVSPTPAWITFDFSADNIMVTVGQVLAFQPIATGSNGQVVGDEIGFNSAPDPYAGGSLFYRAGPCPPGFNCDPPTGGNWVALATILSGNNVDFTDMTFVTTVSPVPEPSTVGLIGLGLLGLGAMARRRRYS
jgi:hypothetical protein